MTRVSERDRAHPLLHAISRARCAVTDLRSRSVDGIVRDFVIFIFEGGGGGGGGRIRKPINYFEWAAVNDRNPAVIQRWKIGERIHRKALESDWSGCVGRLIKFPFITPPSPSVDDTASSFPTPPSLPLIIIHFPDQWSTCIGCAAGGWIPIPVNLVTRITFRLFVLQTDYFHKRCAFTFKNVYIYIYVCVYYLYFSRLLTLILGSRV